MNISYVIIGITALASFYAFSQEEVMRKMIMNPYIVNRRRQYYRFITSGLIHKDHMHLIFNMIALYFFGPIVEMVFKTLFDDLGSIYFILLYVMALIASDIPSYFKYKDYAGYNSLGASGAVSAIVFAFILFLPLEKIYLYFFVPIPGFILGILYLVYSYYQGKKGGDNVNHDAHMYGALFGVIFCVVLYPPVIMHFIEQIKEFRIF